MRHLRRYLATLLVLALCPAVGADDTAYPINLHRKDKVGDVSDTHVTVENIQTMVMTVPGAPAPRTRNESMKLDLQGRSEVMEVNSKEDSTLLKITVKKFTDDTGADLVESGKVIQVKWEDKQVTFSMVGEGEISDKARKALAMIYTPHVETDDNEVFGSKIPRKVGESWPINSEAAAKSLSKIELTVDPKNLKGKITLDGVETIGDAKALRITATMDADGFKGPMPPGVNIDSSTIKSKLSGLFPADESAKRFKSEMTMEMDMEMSMSGNGVKAEAKTHISTKTVTTPVTN